MRGDRAATESPDIVLEIYRPSRVYQILRATGFDKETLGREARESLALRLYGEHRLSLFEAVMITPEVWAETVDR